MEAEIDLNIAFEFVSKEPEPINPEIINAGAQTFDPAGTLLIALLCIILSVGVGFALYKFISKRKMPSYTTCSLGKHVSPTFRTSSRTSFMEKAIIILFAVLIGSFTFIGISKGAKAFANNKEKPGPDKIMVYVDEESNTIEVEDGWFKNIEDQDMLLDHSSLTISEECQDIEELKDCKFKVDGFGGLIYYEHPGNKNFEPVDTKVLSSGETTTLSFKFEDLSVAIAKQLFGKKVFNLGLVSKDIYADTPTSSDLTYNGKSQCGVTEGEGYLLEGDIDVKDADNYTTTAKLKPNYKWQDGSTEDKTFNWKINQAVASITADNIAIEYGDPEPSLTTQIEGLVEGESLIKGTDYSIAREGDKSIGTYDINVTVNSTDVTKNYDFTVNKGTFKINQRTATFEWASSSFTYNGEVQVPVATITNIVEGDDVSVDTYAPASDCDCKSAGNHSAKVSALKGVDADNYSLEDDTNIVEYSIAKAAATITADGKSITYGETIPELTASIEGMVHSESLTKGTDYKLTWDSVEKAGTYTITVTILETQKTNNYSFTCESGTLTISQYKAVFNWATPSFTYNGNVQIPTATITRAKASDDVSIKTYEPLQNFDGLSAGNQKAKVIELDGQDSANYSLDDTSNLVEYSIAKATLTISTDSASKTYDGSPLMASASVTGLQNSEVLIVVNTGEQTDVGESDNTYVVKWDDSATTAKQNNYDISEQTPGKLTVTKRYVKITSKSGTHEFDGNAFKVEEITLEGDGFVEGEGGSAESYNSITQVGDAPNSFVYTLNNNTKEGNYNIEKVFGTLTVTKATINITAPDQSYVYDATPHGAAITASNKTSTPVTITYSLDGSTYTSEVPKITNVAESDEEVLYKAVAENYEDITGSYKLIITPYDISKNTNSYFAKTVNDTIVYDAQEHSVDVSATFKGTTLTKDTDYEVICDKKINASGTADYAYQIKGKNNLSGDSYGTWHILSKSFGDYISITQTKDLVYNFNEINVVSSNALKVTDTTLGNDLTINVDYKVVSGQTSTNASNDIAITIEGMGNYQASKSGKWAILPKDMTGMEDIIQINDSDDPISLEYDSTERNVDVTKVAIKSTFPGVTNEIPNGNYEISCGKKIEANDASTAFYTYKVNFKQNFTGSVDMKWVITPKQIDFLEIYGNRGVFTYDEETTHEVKGYLAKAYEKVDGQLNEISFFKDSDDTLTPKHDDVSITRKEVGKSILDLSQYTWTSNRNFKLPSDPSKFYFDNGYITVNPSDLMSATFTGTCDEATLGASVDYKLTVKNEATEGSLTDVVAVFDIWEDNITRVEKSLGTIEAGSSSEEISVSDTIKDTDFDTSASPAKVMHVTINYKYGESDLANSFETSNSLQRNKVDKPVVQNFTFCNAEVGYPDTDDYTVTGDAKRTNVGDYECIARLNHNYLCWQDGTIAQFKFDYKIIKAKVKVIAKDSSITYGDAAKNEGCDFEGVAEGDTSAETWTPNYSYQNASGEAYTQYASGIGNYRIIPSGLSASNYDLQYVEGKMTVIAKKISLSWSSSKIQYTGEGVAPTASISGDFDGYRTAVSSYQYAVRGTEDWTSEKPKELGLYTAKAVALNSANYELPSTVTYDFEIFEGRKVYAKVETTTGDNPHQKLTIKYDDQFGANDILVLDEPSNDNSMFSAYASTVKEVSFDPSLATYKKIKSTKNWFAGFTNLATISGFENFDTTALTSIEGMFNGCTSLATINLSGFKTKSDTTCTNALAGATALAEVTVGANWNSNLGTCALDGENWLDVNANCLSPANLPVGTAATYTKAKYAISFEFNQDDVGEIEEGTSEIYFNDAHEAKIEVNAQNTNIINITVLSTGGTQDKTYTRTAKATDYDWRFKEWSFNPALSETKCTGNTVVTVNFELKEFPKALFTNDDKLLFRYDNTDYSSSSDYKNVFAVKNTSYTDSASDVLPEWIDASSKSFKVSPKEILIESSFSNFEKYRVSGSDVDFTSVSAWFMNLPITCTSLSGLENITSKVSDYSYLFNNASAVSVLDISGLSVDGTKSITGMFSNCSALNTITFGKTWAVKFDNCGLPGEAWLNSDGKAFVSKDIPVQPATNVTYTLGDKKIQFNKPVEKHGKIDSYDSIYFNDNFETKYDLSGQDNMKLTISVGSQSYVRNAEIVGEYVSFGGWSVSPETSSVITKNSTFTAKFSLDVVAKAVLYGTTQADGALKFFYDDEDHTDDDGYKNQFEVVNTSYEDSVYPKWFTSGATSIQPTSIEFDETFLSSGITSTSGWFAGFNNAASITGMKNIPTAVVNTSYMFYNFSQNSCLSFTGDNELKLSKITNAKDMFKACGNISSLDLSSFNMESSAAINDMFAGCSNLKTFTFADSWKCSFKDSGLTGYWINSNGYDYAVDKIPTNSSSITYTYADKTISFAMSPSDKGKITEEAGTDLSVGQIHFNSKHKVTVVESGTGNNLVSINIYKSGSTDAVGNTVKKKASATDIAYVFNGWSYNPAISSVITDSTTVTANFALDNYGKAIFKNNTLTFKYDNTPVDDEYKLFNTSYSESENANVLPEWFNGTTPMIQPTSIVFDSSFASFTSYVSGSSKSNFNSMAAWFMNFTSVNSITGLNNINSCVIDMSYMFKGCTALTHADLSNFAASDSNKVKNMFTGCTSINKVTVGTSWKVRLDLCGLYDKNWLNSDLDSYTTADIQVPPVSETIYKLANKEVSLFASGANVKFINEATNEEVASVFYNDEWTVEISTSHDEEVDNATWEYTSLKDSVQLTFTSVLTNESKIIICKTEFKNDADKLKYKLSEWTMSAANDSVTAKYIERLSAQAIYYTDGRMVFYYDDFDHRKDVGFDSKYDIKNTNVDTDLLAPWLNPSQKPNIHPTNVVFDNTFTNFDSYADNGKLYAFRSISGWFMNFDSVQGISGLNNISSNIENTSYAFCGFDTKTSDGCINLSSLYLPNLKNTNFMFSKLQYSVKKVVAPNIDNQSSTDEDKLINCCNMFADCETLREISWTSNVALENRHKVSDSSEMFKNCYMLNVIDCSALYITNNGSVTDDMLTNCYTLSRIKFNLDKHLSDLGLFTEYYNWNMWNFDDYAPAIDVTWELLTHDTWFYKTQVVNVKISNAYKYNGDSTDGGGYYTSDQRSVEFYVYEDSTLVMNEHRNPDKIIVSYRSTELFSIPIVSVYPYSFVGFEHDSQIVPEISIYEASKVDAYFHSEEMASYTSKWCFDTDSKTLTLYYDDIDHPKANEFAINTTNPEDVPWFKVRDLAQNIVIDPSFENCTGLNGAQNSTSVPFESIAFWFYGFVNPCHITGLEYIKANIKDAQYLFGESNLIFDDNCLDLSNTNLSHVTNAYCMLDLYSDSKARITSVIFPENAFSEGEVAAQVNSIFGDATYDSLVTRASFVNLKNIYIGPNFGRNVESYQYMFAVMQHTVYIETNNISFENAKDCSYMFYCSNKIESLNFENCNLDHVKDMSNFLYSCGGLTSVNFGNNAFDSLIEASYMFYGCGGLEVIDLSKLNSPEVSFSRTFEACANAKEISINNVETNDLTKITSASYMFSSCYKLETINWTNCRNNGQTTAKWLRAFQYCFSLKDKLFIPPKLDIAKPYKLLAGQILFLETYTGVGLCTSIEYNGEIVEASTSLYDGGYIYFVDHTNLSIKKANDDDNIATLNLTKSRTGSKDGIHIISDEIDTFFKNGSRLSLNTETNNIEITSVYSTKTYTDILKLDVSEKVKYINYNWLVNGSSIPEEGIALDGTPLNIVANITAIDVVPKVGKALFNENDNTLKFVYDDVEYASPYRVFPIDNYGQGKWKEFQSLTKYIVFDETFKDFTMINDHEPFYSMQNWFAQFQHVESITGLENIHNGITDASGMFFGFIPKFECLDLSKLKFDNLEYAMGMFSSFGNIYNRSMQFTYTLILPDNFASNTQCDVSKMFEDSFIQSIEFGNNSFRNQKNFMGMFSKAWALNSLDLSGFSTQSESSGDLISLQRMCEYCPYLYSIKFWSGYTFLSSFTDIFAFDYCITEIDMSHLDFSNADYSGPMVYQEMSPRVSKFIVGGWKDGQTLANIGIFPDIDQFYPWYKDGELIKDDATKIIPEAGCLYSKNMICKLTICADYNNYVKIHPNKFFFREDGNGELNVKSINVPTFLKQDIPEPVDGLNPTFFGDITGWGMDMIDPVASSDLNHGFYIMSSSISGASFSHFEYDDGIQNVYIGYPIRASLPAVVNPSATFIARYDMGGISTPTAKIVSCKTGEETWKSTLYYDTKDHSSDLGFVEMFNIINTSEVSDEYQPWTRSKSFGMSNKIVIDKSFANCTSLPDKYGILRPFESMAGWFRNNSATSIIGLEYINGQNLHDLSQLFAGAGHNVETELSLDISKFNTSNVTKMDGMFLGSNYSYITASLEFANHATSIVNMFRGCVNLKELDLRSFNTNNFISEDSYAGTFDEMFTLEQIRVGENWGLPFELFKGLSNYKWADGSGNELHGVPLSNTIYYRI